MLSPDDHTLYGRQPNIEMEVTLHGVRESTIAFRSTATTAVAPITLIRAGSSVPIDVEWPTKFVRTDSEVEEVVGQGLAERDQTVRFSIKIRSSELGYFFPERYLIVIDLTHLLHSPTTLHSDEKLDRRPTCSDSLSFEIRSLETEEDVANFYLMEGSYQLERGDVQLAVSSLERLVQLRPEQPALLALLGHAYLRAGKCHEAVQLWKQLLPTLSNEQNRRLQARVVDGIASAYLCLGGQGH
ncbi:MAG TPA: tetratricopeptide repeat protein [Vicinamibacterales bacterium]|nr:tetratricopeptide repeat protein [Vicinamibacterales bacterium]